MPARLILSPAFRGARSSVLRAGYRHALYSTTNSCIKVAQTHAPHSGNIKVLSLDRPSARNAISRQLLADLTREITAIHKEGENGPTRALIIASESDDAFCAGADLKERKGMSQEETRAFLTQLRDTYTLLSALRIPTISAISSAAFGGGLELALCTTFRVMSSSAQVGLPETRLAIIPGAGGTYRLPALIGTAKARDLILTGRRVPGPEAYFLGLCDRLVEVTEEDEKVPGMRRGKVLAVAVSLARDICEGGPVAVKAALEAVNCWGAGDTAENEAYEKVLATEDRLEALRAFGDKRAPMFKGR